MERDATAYLIVDINAMTLRIVGVKIVSEPMPTHALCHIQATILSVAGPSFGEARAQMLHSMRADPSRKYDALLRAMGPNAESNACRVCKCGTQMRTDAFGVWRCSRCDPLYWKRCRICNTIRLRCVC